jgi:hypothetical protein
MGPFEPEVLAMRGTPGGDFVMRTIARLARTSTAATRCHRSGALHSPLLPKPYAVSHGKPRRKGVPLALVRGRVSVMVDLVRHEFMGPATQDHFTSTTETTNSVLRTIHIFIVQSARAKDMVRHDQIPIKVSPLSGGYLSVLRSFFCAQPACARLRRPKG